MKWFEGSIPAAIQKAKENQAIFIVYISGTDDVSKQMDVTWSVDDVEDVCEQNQCVAIKLAANSDSCAQFCMIYPVVCIPCTFFIGENGVPLEVTGGHVESTQFVEKINQVLQLHQSQKSGQKVEPLQKNPEGALPSATTSTAQGAAPSATATTPQGAAPSVTATTPQGAAPSAGSFMESASAIQSTGSGVSEMEVSPGPSASAVPLDERIQKAKELVAQKREEKMKKEAEEQKQKDQERIQLGRDMAKLRMFKEEQARKEAVEEWKKEKEEKKREKERIREQLARDREEKAVKFRKEREDREKSTQEAKRVKLEAAAADQAKAEAAKMERARIQFRLPDGSSLTHQFSSSDTLETARQFVAENIGSTYGQFSFSTHYPKRDFTEADLPQTLLALDLAPSSVIIVLPGSRSMVARSGGGSESGGLFVMLLAPFMALWTFLYNLLFGAPAQPRGAYNSPQQSEPPSGSQDSGDSSGHRNRPKSSYGLRRRQEGNITRLSSLQDDDDKDRPTWNGNSTQQM